MVVGCCRISLTKEVIFEEGPRVVRELAMSLSWERVLQVWEMPVWEWARSICRAVSRPVWPKQTERKGEKEMRSGGHGAGHTKPWRKALWLLLCETHDSV